MRDIRHLLSILVLALVSTTSAVSPGLISYQGYLTNGSGTPLTGNYSIRFSIYSQPSSGSALWSETRTVPVVDGRFNVQLGDISSITASMFQDSIRYLGIKVGSDQEITPRSRLVSVPYSFEADNAARLGGQDVSEFALLGGSNSFIGSANNFSGEIRLIDNVFSFREGNRHRWKILNPASAGLQFQQVYDDANSLLNLVRLEIADNGNIAIGTTNPDAKLHVATADPVAGKFTSSDNTDDTRVISAEVTGAYNNATPVAVWGRSVMDTVSGGGYGGEFIGGTSGVTAYGYEFGMWGYGTDKTPSGQTTYGVVGIAAGSTGGGSHYGVYGQGWGGASNYGGYFLGNVSVTGNLSKGGGSFKIDHPIDPENKYLYHSFVESPDMMNIYNGIILLDATGEADVNLPDYFQALNRDFRYQLTAIGQPAPGLYIAKKINGNRFRIAGGQPGMEVSWEVTGVRKDAYAEANRIPVEVDKPAEERGYFVHPEAFGKPQELGIDFRNRPTLNRAESPDR